MENKKRGIKVKFLYKLIIGFGVVGVILITISILGYHSVRHSSELLEEAYAYKIRPLAEVNRLQSYAYRIRFSEVELSNMEDPWLFTSRTQELKKNAEDFDKELKQFTDLYFQKRKEETSRLIQLWEDYHEDLKSAIVHAQNGDMAEVKQITMYSSYPSFWDFSKWLEQISSKTEQTAQQEYLQARDQLEHERRRFEWLTTIGTFLTILFTIVIARSLSNRVRLLMEGVSHFADGRMDFSIPLKGNDELTDLAVTFNEMSHKIQKREEELRKSHHFTESVLENIPDMIFVKEVENLSWVRFNKAGEELIGYPREELLGKTDYDFFPRDQADFFTAKDREILQSGEFLDIPEEPILVKDKELRWLHTRKILLFDKNGKPEYLVGISEDITRRKQAEEELKKHRDHLEELVKERTAELTVAKEQAEAAQSAAEAANQAKSAFLANMSHELRTPLNAILGYAQILKRRPLEADVINGLNIVQQSGEHLLTLITDILDLAKIEAGRMELSPAPIHFHNFLEHVAGIIRSRAQAKGLTFNFERLDTLPTWVETDETRLRQVLLNLLDNAVKFTDEGQVTLRVSSVKCQVSSDMPRMTLDTGTLDTHKLRFEVIDTGPGIPPDQVERIFQPFEQARDVTRTEGTGLGLAISRQLVQLMGGDLQVESKVGRGSRFWFEVALPVTEVTVEAAQPPGPVITGYRGPRRMVLVVDDIPSNRAVLIDMLEPLGFDVVEAADGRQAIHLAQEIRPDLILMDRWMPMLDGFEATRQIRQVPGLQGMVVIAVSASVSAEDQAQSREAGINAFLPKPVNWPRLAGLLAEHLGLAWEYEGKDEGRRLKAEAEPAIHPSSFIIQEERSELVPPPQEELAVLYDLAMRGNMRAIRERAAHIETLGEQYVPFAHRLGELARDFEERQLLALIEQHMEED